jgi:cytochrome c oxidase assembly protein subunit 15
MGRIVLAGRGQVVPLGVTILGAPPAARDRLPEWSANPALLRRLALASVIANVVIVVTGGAVRLTNSGLGCPTWPRCSGSSLVPTHKLGIHSAIEFSNRSLTFVLTVIVVATLLIAWRQRSEQRLALVAFLGIPAQAVLGGIVVLTDLNPWLVAAHFLLSMSLIAVTLVLYLRIRGTTAVASPIQAVVLARGLVVVTAAVLALGTVVTGSGPHAGDLDTNGKLHRIDLSPSGVVQLHADAVMVLIGLTIGLIALLAVLRADAAARRTSVWLLGIELAQGVIGYTQYFLHVPALLVGFHMLGACLVWIAALTMLVRLDSHWTGAVR